MLIEPTVKQVNNRKFIDGVMIDEFIKNNEVPAIIFNGSRVKQLSLYLSETIKKVTPIRKFIMRLKHVIPQVL